MSATHDYRFLGGVRPQALRDLYIKAVDLGCSLELTRSNHVKVRLPNGEQMSGSLTSSDRKSVLATRTNLRRKGLDI